MISLKSELIDAASAWIFDCVSRVLDFDDFEKAETSTEFLRVGSVKKDFEHRNKAFIAVFFSFQSEVNSDSNWEERGERKLTVEIERLDYR